MITRRYAVTHAGSDRRYRKRFCPGSGGAARCLVALAGLCALSLAFSHGAAPAREQASQAQAESATRYWRERLERLRPSEPEAYFLLAEEVADRGGPDAEHLARHLFGLAGALDRRRFGRSACLAIAELAIDGVEAARCRAVATLLDERGGVAPPESSEPSGDVQGGRLVGEMLSFYRRGMGSQAERRIGRDLLEPILERHTWAFDSDVPTFLESLRRLRSGERPSLDPGAVRRQLQLELGLMRGEERAWSADLRMTGARPLVEADPSRLDDLFGIDTRLSVFRNGRWMEP